MGRYQKCHGQGHRLSSHHGNSGVRAAATRSPVRLRTRRAGLSRASVSSDGLRASRGSFTAAEIYAPITVSARWCSAWWRYRAAVCADRLPTALCQTYGFEALTIHGDPLGVRIV